MADTKKLKKAAEIMFIEQGKAQKEISVVLNISEQTISKWVKDGKWKEERNARLNSVEKRAEDIKAVIGTITERRIEITGEIIKAKASKDKKLVAELQTEAVAIGQEVAMYSKALIVMDKSNKPTLSLYLDIMDDVFKCLNKFDGALYMKTLDFQAQHIRTVSQRLG